MREFLEQHTNFGLFYAIAMSDPMTTAELLLKHKWLMEEFCQICEMSFRYLETCKKKDDVLLGMYMQIMACVESIEARNKVEEMLNEVRNQKTGDL